MSMRHATSWLRELINSRREQTHFFVRVVVYQCTKLFSFWSEKYLTLIADALLKNAQLLFVSEWM